MNIAYLIYQAERQPSAAEQWASDARRGELASGLAQLLHRRPSAPGNVRAASAGATARPHHAARDLACDCYLGGRNRPGLAAGDRRMLLNRHRLRLAVRARDTKVGE